jgi:hypothetical protein
MAIFILRNMGKARDTHTFDESTSLVKTVGVRMETRGKFDIEDQQILGATVQSLVSTATWPSGFVNNWMKE